MDIVVCSHLKDFQLLNLFFQSYDLYYHDKAQLILFIWRWEQTYLDQLHQPIGLRVIYKDDVPELNSGDDFRNQLYLKLIAYRYAQSEYFLVCDSDFLFCAPTYAKDFFDKDNKPYWFIQNWVKEYNVWREGTEAILKHDIAYEFMAMSQYLLKKSILASLDNDCQLQQLLIQPNASEFVLYGAYVYYHPTFHDVYHWQFRGDYRVLPITHNVNQIAHGYLELDQTTKFEDFKLFKLLAFWSHWNLAAIKMAEFFEASQLMHFGKIKKISFTEKNLNFGLMKKTISHWQAFITGVDADGWVQHHIQLLIADPDIKNLTLHCEVPGHINGTYNPIIIKIDAKIYILEPGLQTLNIDLFETTYPQPLNLNISGGFVAPGLDTRQLRFRLLDITCD